MATDAILHDFASGRMIGAGPLERMGLFLMHTAALMLAPMEFKGFSHAARLVRTVLPSQRAIRVKFADDCQFEYPYGDGYWGVLLDNRRTYDPGSERFLKFVSDVPYAFIDCGANFGYMSVVVSSSGFGSKPAIAIEADADNYERVVRNCEINGNRFDHRHNAIFSKSGEKVSLYGAKHEARSILAEGGGPSHGMVVTLALDDLDGWVKAHGDGPIVLKLDVEGVEEDAIKGADRLLKRDSLIIYEDHGGDSTHQISRFLKDACGMRLFYGETGGLGEIERYEQLDAIKTNRRKGYDLLATRDKFWLAKVDAFAETLKIDG
jgi:FkbM family methyltransferase